MTHFLIARKIPEHVNLLGTLTILRILSILAPSVAQYTRKKKKGLAPVFFLTAI